MRVLDCMESGGITTVQEEAISSWRRRSSCGTARGTFRFCAMAAWWAC